jgi:hypothetical protein
VNVEGVNVVDLESVYVEGMNIVDLENVDVEGVDAEVADVEGVRNV